MTLIEFWLEVDHRHRNLVGVQRYGQVAFNLLNEVRPDLADRVIGSDIDPFYVHFHQTDYRFLRFCDFLIDNWEG